MPAARNDLDIFWILVVAVAFVMAIWKHGEVTSWLSNAWTRLF
jgi:hypothetical protein